MKRSILVERAGGPLAATLEAVVVERPQPTAEWPQPLCLDRGCDNPSGWRAAIEHDYVPQIRPIGEAEVAPGQRRFPPRRWVVARTLAWLSKCRAILVRYEKHACNYLGLLQLACALLWFRRWLRLSILR